MTVTSSIGSGSAPANLAPRSASAERAGNIAFIALAVFAVAWWVYFRVATGIQLEDALIAYRYAVNLAEGRGLVFNAGENVLGTTSVSHTLLLAGFAKAFGANSLFYVSTVIGIVFSIATGWLALLSARQLGFSRALQITLVALVWFHPDMAWTTVGGMETPQVLFLMSASMWAWIRRRLVIAGLACGALLVARPDAAIWVVLLGGAVCFFELRASWRFCAPLAAVYGLWAIGGFATYGSPVPHSLIAKGVVVQRDVAADLWSNFVPHSLWIGSALGSKPDGAWWALIWLALFALGTIGAVAAWHKRYRANLAFLSVYPLAVWAGYWIGRAPREFRWYLVPLAFGWSVLATLGAKQLASFARARLSPGSSARVLRPAAATALLMVGAYYSRANLHTLHRQRDYQRMENALRKSVGVWLRDNTPTDATVAMEAVGYQGFYSQRRVVDLAGLVSPAVVEIHRRAHDSAEAFDEVLQTLAPDFVVLRSFEIDRGESFFGGPLFDPVRSKERFFDSYEEVERFSVAGANTWGELGALTLYRRRGV